MNRLVLLCASAHEGHRYYKMVPFKDGAYDDADLQELANASLLTSKYHWRINIGMKFEVSITEVEPQNGVLEHNKFTKLLGYIFGKVYDEKFYQQEKQELLQRVPKRFAEYIEANCKANGYAARLDAMQMAVDQIDEAIRFHYKGVKPTA